MTMHTQPLSSDNLRNGQVGRDPSTGQFASLDIGRAATCDDECLAGNERLITDINPRHPNSTYVFLSTETHEERFGRMVNGDATDMTEDFVYSCCDDPEQAAILLEELRQAQEEALGNFTRGFKSPERLAEERHWEAVLAENAPCIKRAAAKAKRHRQDATARAEGRMTKTQRRRRNKAARKAAAATIQA